MPSLPLPTPLSDGVPIDGGLLPVSSPTDVANEWAPELQAPATAPLRDAMQAGQAAMLLEYQRASRYAAAQSDVGRATDEYLDECGDEREVYRQPGEPNGTYRGRMLGNQSVVSPVAIVAAANAVLAAYTAVPCRYVEESDGWFVGDGTTPWSSHVFATADVGGANATPNYPDRIYPGAVAAGLASAPNRRPPGAMPNIDTCGRWFLLRVPDISALDTEIAAVFNGSQNEPTSGYEGAGAVGGFFCGAGSTLTDQNISFVFDFTSTTVDGVYNALVSAVNAIVGEGIRWDLIVDPALVP